MRGKGKRSDGTGQTPGNKGRFEGYDVLAQRPYWDDTTAEVVLKRVESSPEGLSYFTETEARTAGALVDLLLAQHDDPKIPVLEMVDRRLDAGDTDGWRYEDLPEDGEAWRVSLAYLEEDSKEAFGTVFSECSLEQQCELVQGIQDSDRWHGLTAAHVWSLWTRYACAAFYSHPYAWNEVGFGGPAYPRGYKVLHPGWREPWERPEVDAEDPVPWMQRAEAARQAHEVRTRHER